MTTPDLIIAAARSWIGTPYRHQASVKAVGCDCLGLVRGVWREVLGTEPETMPAYSPDWAEAGGRETLVEAASRHMMPVAYADMQPGDLLLFRWRRHLPAKHAGILASDVSFIHAQDGACVCEAPLSPWWRRRIAYVFRFPAHFSSPLAGEGASPKGERVRGMVQAATPPHPALTVFAPPSPARGEGNDGPTLKQD